ncbi:hypothetical protein LUZ60_006056 [Juncus effusus]|nr:hypothetical protein LUZ60_006056 [Juncus effusus]
MNPIKPDLGAEIQLLNEKVKFQSGVSAMVQEFKNFKNSSEPSRFLFFQNGSWSDCSSEVFKQLHDGFVHGKATLEVEIDGNLFIFDFLRKIKVDSQTGATNSIAWIDTTGKCFFPKITLDGSKSIAPKSDNSIQTENDSNSSSNSNPKRRIRETIIDNNRFEERTDESPEISSSISNSTISQGSNWKNTQIVNREDKFYKVVEKLFLAGISRSSVATRYVVTRVQKCLHMGPIGALRLKAFQNRVQVFKSLRGEKCVKFGWYGTDLKDLESILEFGFGKSNNDLLGDKAHGIGVHLSPPHSPFASAMVAEEDENGERHIMLCRVITGRAERVGPGSTHYHPSSIEYDSGVDDVNNPNWYVIWNMYANTHIIPEYIVSFKIDKENRGVSVQNGERVKRPSVVAHSTNLLLQFPNIISAMKASLPRSSIQTLHLSFIRYKEGKINKDTFIRVLRSVAGDKLLVATIRKIRGY